MRGRMNNKIIIDHLNPFNKFRKIREKSKFEVVTHLNVCQLQNYSSVFSSESSFPSGKVPISVHDRFSLQALMNLDGISRSYISAISEIT